MVDEVFDEREGRERVGIRRDDQEGRRGGRVVRFGENRREPGLGGEVGRRGHVGD